jgi:hypothetical protein
VLVPGGGVLTCAQSDNPVPQSTVVNPANLIDFVQIGQAAIQHLWSEWAHRFITDATTTADVLEKWTVPLASTFAPPDRENASALYNDWLGCKKHLADVDELRTALSMMPANTTGGPLGTTRAHFLHMPASALELPL